VEVDRYYDAIDVLAFPRMPMRLTELVTPLKPLEAMARGKAVVASDVGGHRELVRDGDTGLLHRAGDASALAATLARMLQDTALRDRIQRNGRAFVEKERTWSHNVMRYRDAYALVGQASA
jgi:glycosyltransferase involved in cell wall biosynthesis